MMKINASQVKAFSHSKWEEFIQKSLPFLRDNFKEWCVDRKEDELRKFILETVDFGKQYRIGKEINIQKLMHFKIEFNFNLKKYDVLQKEINRADINEDQKTENLYLLLASENYKLIPVNLNTTLL